jgi:hypothetical protein
MHRRWSTYIESKLGIMDETRNHVTEDEKKSYTMLQLWFWLIWFLLNQFLLIPVLHKREMRMMKYHPYACQAYKSNETNADENTVSNKVLS